MTSDIAFLTTYTCPGCGIRLETLADEWQDWRTCPECGRPARPPVQRRLSVPDEREPLYIGPYPTTPTFDGGATDPMASSVPRPVPPVGPMPMFNEGNAVRRLVLGGGFFLAVVLAIVSVVQQAAIQAGVFGFVALILLALLAQSSRRPD